MYIEDINFLDSVVWNIARQSVLQHDSFSCGKFGDVNVKNIFTSHIDKKNILDIFDFFIFIHFHYMNMQSL